MGHPEMRMLGAIMLVCMALALLRAALTAILVVILGAIIVSAVCQPMRTFAGGFSLICLGLIGQHPVAGLGLLATLAIVTALSK